MNLILRLLIKAFAVFV